jgi:glutamine amidotransferase
VLDLLDAGASPPEALAAVTARAAAGGESRLNLLLGDGRTVHATTYGNSLFTLAGHGLAAGGVLVASEPLDDDPAWTPVPELSVVEASASALAIRPLSSLGGPAA